MARIEIEDTELEELRQRAERADAADADKAAAESERDKILKNRDAVLSEKKSLSDTIKSVLGDASELTPDNIAEKLRALKNEKAKAGNNEELSELISELTATKSRLEKIETESEKSKASESFEKRKNALTKEFAKHKLDAEQLDDALALALKDLKGSDRDEFGEYVTKFLEKRPHFVPSGFNVGVESKVKQSQAKDAKVFAEEIRQKRQRGERITPADMAKLKQYYVS